LIRFLLDTNVCIDLLRGNGGEILRHLRHHDLGEIGICTITLAELQHGVFKSSDPARNMKAVAEFCAAFAILPFDGLAAEAYGRIRAELERVGTPIGPLDTLIAACALAIGCVLVTNNRREFNRVKGLAVENWRGPQPE
jgi:tRNA(fMet)-specific endonuclease VapC